MTTTPVIDDLSPAYDVGEAAAFDSRPRALNPYDEGDPRRAWWWAGYDDMRADLEAAFGKEFDVRLSQTGGGHASA